MTMLDKQTALEHLKKVANYIAFGDVGGESRTYVNVPVQMGEAFAREVANSLASLGAITTEVYDTTTEGGFEYIPVKGKGGAELVKANLIRGGINFPRSGLSSDQVCK
jgi:hypothetical protein